jgi:hypothetical protein
MRSSPDRQSSGTGPATSTASIGNERLRVICHCALLRLRGILRSRKNWLFSDTVAGAKASLNLYSLIETCKANDVDVYRYLVDLFKGKRAINPPLARGVELRSM